LAPSDQTAGVEPAATWSPAGDGRLLAVEGLCAGYGRKQVVFDVSFHVEPGEVVAILGHNGAGKTTTLRAVFGSLPLTSGRVMYSGEEVSHRPSTARNVQRGMSLIPSEHYVFQDLTVLDNLRLGAVTVLDRAARQERLELVYRTFPILQERTRQRAGTLSGGQQRMVSLGVALMSSPRLLLLDEPSLGLAPNLVDRILAVVRRLAEDQGLAVVLIEQNVQYALQIAQRVYVMRSGRLILEESSAALQAMGREKWWELF
jgi:branched-chain amino acid transport system ATP-binding protein